MCTVHRNYLHLPYARVIPYERQTEMQIRRRRYFFFDFLIKGITYPLQNQESHTLHSVLSIGIDFVGNDKKISGCSDNFMSLLLKIEIDMIDSIGKISVYKHCFCYSNVPTTGTKDPLFRQPMRLWLAHK